MWWPETESKRISRTGQIPVCPTDVVQNLLILLQPFGTILKDKFGAERDAATDRQIEIVQRYDSERHPFILRGMIGEGADFGGN